MTSLTILDILYLVLVGFSIILGTLLTIVLVKIIKILGPIVEISQMYYQVKSSLAYYSQVPNLVKEKIVSFITRSEEEKVEK